MKSGRNHFLHFIYGPIVVIVSLFILSAACCADKKDKNKSAPKILTVTVDVPAVFDGLAAIGIVVAGEQTFQFPGAEVTRATPDLLTVRFSLDTTQFPEGSMATAIVVGARGAKAYGPIRPIGPTSAQTSRADIPLCAPEKIKMANAEGQLGVLQSLYDVRLARRKVLQTKLTRILTPEFLARINSLERGFGLDRDRAITLETNPAELIDRVARVRNAVQQYRLRKDSQK